MPVDNLTFQAGRMNTLIGYEVIESPLNPNFSRSFMFGIGEPFTVTGVRASFDFSDSASLAVSAINSFTGLQADTITANPSKRSFLSRPWITWDFPCSVSGDLRAIEDKKLRTACRSEASSTCRPPINLELVLEGYYGNQANPGNTNARWNGVAGYAIYDFNDQWGLHVRAEVFEDAAGAFSCFGSDASKKDGGNYGPRQCPFVS